MPGSRWFDVSSELQGRIHPPPARMLLEGLSVSSPTTRRSARRYRLLAVFQAFLILASMWVPMSVAASATVNATSTLNGSTGVITVAPSATIAAVVSVTTTGSGTANDWNSTAWRIATTAPGTTTCVDTPDHSGANTYSEGFNITAPAAAGTYNLYLLAYNGAACASGASALFTRTNTVIVANPPVVTSGGGTLAYVENQVATAIASTLTVTDSDSANLTGASVQLTTNYQNGQDILGFTNQLGITGTFTAATGTMALTGTTTVANYQTALRAVTYFNNSENPNTATRTVSFTATDGSATSAASTKQISVAATNDNPTISDITNQAINMNGNTGALPFTIGDAETAAASLTVGGTSNNTTLVPNNVANITFGGSGAARTVTITPATGQIGTATITVTVTDANSGTAVDTFDVVVTVGVAGSGSGTMTVAPPTAVAGSTGNSLVFTFAAPSGSAFAAGSYATLAIPAAWGTPTLGDLAVANASGTTCAPGAPSIALQVITVPQTCSTGNSFTLTVNNLTAPTAAGALPFIAGSHAGAGGSSTALASSPSVTVTAATATKLVITSVNGGSSPNPGVAFSVIVQAQDQFNNPSNLGVTTLITLSKITGAGTLGGTLTGNITSGTNSVTISGVTYSQADTGVVIQAAGGGLTVGQSTFNVVAVVKAWTGTTNTTWNTANVNNWSPSGAPTSANDITISDVPNDPILAGANAQTVNNMSISNGILNVSGGPLTVNGNATIATGSLTVSGSGIVVVTGDLTIGAGASGSVTVSGGQLEVHGNLIINNGATLTISGGTVFLFGAITRNGSGNFSTSGTSVFNYAGANQTIASGTYRQLSLSGSGTKTAGGDIVTTGDFQVLINTTFDASTFSHQIAGNFDLSGAINAGTSTITFNGAGSANQSVGSISSALATFNTLHNVVIARGAGTGAVSGAGLQQNGITFDGSLTVTSGTLDLAFFFWNHTAGANTDTFSVANGATLRLYQPTAEFPIGWNTTTLGATSTVEYYGDTGPQHISAQSYGNLTMLGTGTGLPKTLDGNLTVAGTLSLGAAVVTTDGFAITANGAVTRSTGFVNGNLRKPISINASPATVNFEVGAGSTYAPASLSVPGGSVINGGFVTASTAAGQHANFATSDLEPSKYVSRTWSLVADGGLTLALSTPRPSPSSPATSSARSIRPTSSSASGTARPGRRRRSTRPRRPRRSPARPSAASARSPPATSSMSSRRRSSRSTARSAIRRRRRPSPGRSRSART